MDTVARLYAEKLQAALGKPFVVENKPGASLMLAANYVAKAAPDGYTLMVSTASTMAINPFVYKVIPYKVSDFVPVSFYVKVPFILVINPDLPIKNVAELITLAKQRRLNYSSPGLGVPPHLAMEYLKQHFGVDMTHVPYRSTPQSVQDIIANHVQLGFAEAGLTLPHIRGGDLRALAVSSSTRLSNLPEVPPFSEVANAPGFEAVSWHMLFAPANTPMPIVDKLHAEMARIMRDPEMQYKVTEIGLLPIDPPSVAEAENYMVAERKKWGALVRKLGLEGSQ